MKKILITTILLLLIVFSYSQGVAINTDGSTANSSAILDVKSTSQGILFPRMTDSQRDAISSPADGLTIFNTTSGCIEYYVNPYWYKLCGKKIQNIIPQSGNNSYTICSGNLYDSEGSDNQYINSNDGYTVIYPSISGNFAQISGDIVTESCCDYIEIYDGVGISGTLLWTGRGTITLPTITSSVGELTVRFVSDGSVVYSGLNLTISCTDTPPSATCTYSICLLDTYGDGWNGGAVTVTANGVEVLSSSTLASGYGPSCYDFTIVEGQNIVVNYTTGSWSYENYYTVYNSSGGVGTVIFSSPNGSTPPTTQTITNNCN
jgi:hypothetical protein